MAKNDFWQKPEKVTAAAGIIGCCAGISALYSDDHNSDSDNGLCGGLGGSINFADFDGGSHYTPRRSRDDDDSGPSLGLSLRQVQIQVRCDPPRRVERDPNIIAVPSNYGWGDDERL